MELQITQIASIVRRAQKDGHQFRDVCFITWCRELGSPPMAGDRFPIIVSRGMAKTGETTLAFAPRITSTQHDDDFAGGVFSSAIAADSLSYTR